MHIVILIIPVPNINGLVLVDDQIFFTIQRVAELLKFAHSIVFKQHPLSCLKT